MFDDFLFSYSSVAILCIHLYSIDTNVSSFAGQKAIGQLRLLFTLSRPICLSFCIAQNPPPRLAPIYPPYLVTIYCTYRVIYTYAGDPWLYLHFYIHDCAYNPYCVYSTRKDSYCSCCSKKGRDALLWAFAVSFFLLLLTSLYSFFPSFLITSDK
jgi:hypothetical protein